MLWLFFLESASFQLLVHVQEELRYPAQHPTQTQLSENSSLFSLENIDYDKMMWRNETKKVEDEGEGTPHYYFCLCAILDIFIPIKMHVDLANITYYYE